MDKGDKGDKGEEFIEECTDYYRSKKIVFVLKTTVSGNTLKKDGVVRVEV